jgi:hypothetical protein
MPKATSRRIRTDGIAWCLTCGKKNWTRERTRLHVAQNGHIVRFVIEDITIYKPTEGTNG